jgi:hypothetical protein
MAKTKKKRGRTPLPEPKKSQKTPLPIYGKAQWSFSGLGGLPSPYGLDWAQGYVPDEIRTEMLKHPKVSQTTNLLKAGILGDGGRVVPCLTPQDEGWELAWELTQVCAFGLRHIKGSWHGLARQLLDAIEQCHKVAVKTLREHETGQYQGYWLPDRLQILPNWTYQFMRDETGEYPVIRVRMVGREAEDIDRDRCVVMTFRPSDGSIWGSTVLSTAYEPFYFDVQLDPEEMAMLAQFGRPTVVVIAPGRDPNGNYPPAIPVYESDGVTPRLNELGDPIEIPVTIDIANKLEGYEAGSIVILPGDTTFKLAEAQKGGEDFARSHEIRWRMIACAILGTDQLTESKNQLSSDNKGIAQDVAGLGFSDGARALEETVENDIFRDIVLYNYGEAALDYLPIFDLGSGKSSRLISLMNSVAAYVANGAFDEAQWFSYCISVGLPLPNPKAKKVVQSKDRRGSGGNQGNKSETDSDQEPAN